MSYCPKCGHKVDETMTFCPNCGASLKTPTYQSATPSHVYPRYRNEKQEKQEKGEKHEKGQGGMVGWLIAGLLLLFFGVVAYTNILFNWVPTGPLAGAFWLITIGVVIIVVGIYYATRARRHFPEPT